MSRKNLVIIQSYIDVAPQKLFEFHLDTNNLPLITPKNISVTIVSLPQKMQAGEQVILDIKKFGLSQRWKVVLEKIEKGRLIRDNALESPFSSFVHDHLFEPFGEGSLLIDKIEFTLPFSPWSDIIVPLVKKDITTMFTYRHEQTKQLIKIQA